MNINHHIQRSKSWASNKINGLAKLLPKSKNNTNDDVGVISDTQDNEQNQITPATPANLNKQDEQEEQEGTTQNTHTPQVIHNPQWGEIRDVHPITGDPIKEYEVETLQLLYGLRFFQKKNLNGGLNVFEMHAYHQLIHTLRDENVVFTKEDLQKIPALSADSYLPLMARLSAHTGLFTSLKLTGDIDQDLILCHKLLNKIKTTPANQIRLDGFSYERVNVYQALIEAKTLGSQNTLIVIQQDNDGFCPILAKYLMIFMRELKDFEQYRPKKKSLPLVKETPNAVDAQLHKDRFVVPSSMPLNEKAQIGDLQKNDDEPVESDEQVCDCFYQVADSENGLLIKLNYQGEFA